MNSEQQQIIDKAYENYYEYMRDDRQWELDKEEFINKCKTDSDFSQKWGLKIEERELTTVKERKKYDKYYDDLIGEYLEHHETLDKRGVPRKITTITYKNEKIECYEN